MYDTNDPARGRRIAGLRAGLLMNQAALATAAGLGAVTVKWAEAGRSISKNTAQVVAAGCAPRPVSFIREPSGLGRSV